MVLIKGSYEDKYNAVGSIMYTRSKHGSLTPVQVGKDGMAIILSNKTGSSSVVNVPYVDVLYLNGESTNEKSIDNKSDMYQKKTIQSPFCKL